MMRKVRTLTRAAALAFSFAITSGFLYFVVLIFGHALTSPSATIPRQWGWAIGVFQNVVPVAVFSISVMFALLMTPLTAWSVGSASWSSLKKFLLVFWLVLSLFIVITRNFDGLILLFGSGLILLCLLRNRERSALVTTRSGDITVFVVLTLFTCVLSAGMLFRDESRVYFAEIFAIYAVACICQSFKVFPALPQMRSASKDHQATESN